jgi:integrase
VNRDLEILKTFFRWAVTAFDLPEHHAKIVRSVKKFREATERVRSLSTAEESKLLGRLNVWAGRVTRLVLLTGMRQGELLGLRKTSVDLQHGTLTLTDTKNREPRVRASRRHQLPVPRHAPHHRDAPPPRERGARRGCEGPRAQEPPHDWSTPRRPSEIMRQPSRAWLYAL